MAEEDEGLAAGIIDVTEYSVQMPIARKTFLPWHRPRKQFVRDYQWLDQIERLLADDPGEGTFRYLGLPGTDLLDLRFFHSSVCADRGLEMRFLGFNMELQSAGEARTELNVSIDEVRRLGRVDPRSDVIGDDFARIANDSSIGWKKARDLGPFDVINLDLCGGFAQEPPGDMPETLYDALAKLLALQARNKTPWLLFLTTRAAKDHVHEAVLDRLLAIYEANLEGCEPFKTTSVDELNIADRVTLDAAVGEAARFLPVFLCGVCKWLASIALSQVPPTRVEVKSVVGYRVLDDAEAMDLVSMAVKFTPSMAQAPDPAGLAQRPADPIDECDAALQFLGRVSKVVDVDGALATDTTLSGRMADAMAGLLDEARYDVPAYREWVAAGCPA